MQANRLTIKAFKTWILFEQIQICVIQHPSSSAATNKVPQKIYQDGKVKKIRQSCFYKICER